MARRPRKKSKCEAPVRLTTKQQRLLEEAAVTMFVDVKASDPFALLLLEAATTNSNCTELTIWAETIPRKFLDALTRFLVANPCIRSLFFCSLQYDPFGPSVDDDFTVLIAAMVGSQSLQEITIQGCLPLKLEEAIIEVLRQKSTSISLKLEKSMIFAVHPIAFGTMLATTKCLSHLTLNEVKVVGDQPYDRSHLRDGLQKNQSLKGIKFEDDCEPGIVNDILECTEFIESLTVAQCLDSTSAALLTKFISKHEKLVYLYVDDTPDTVEALCEAVSCSRSLTELQINPYSNVSAISRMLQQTTSLQKLRLESYGDKTNFETLAVGLEACKTLVTLRVSKAKVKVKDVRALLKVVLSNPNLSEIIGLQYHTWVGQQEEKPMSRLQMDLSFYLAFNKEGRALLQADVPLGVWPYALKKAGSSSLPDALYTFLQEMPVLIKYHSSVH